MTAIDLGAYATIVFDCDGVVLDSNRIKTETFHAVALHYGQAAADALVMFHVAHGGVSRYRKFDHLFRGILGREPELGEMDIVLQGFAAVVSEALLTCTVSPALKPLRDLTPKASWVIASGGDQTELRDVFAQRGLDSLFDGGIFGSPDPKGLIVEREIVGRGISPAQALLIGDSRMDYEVAEQVGLDFLFLWGWSEFEDWRDFFADHPVPVLPDLVALARTLGPRTERP